MNQLFRTNFERRAKDHYPTPIELSVGLLTGLRKMTRKLPQHLLDPCGGDGAIAEALGRYGYTVSLTDFYPDLYRHRAYAAKSAVDATNPQDLDFALKLTGAKGIVTNTPYGTQSDRFARAMLKTHETTDLEILCLLYPVNWAATVRRMPYFERLFYTGQIVCTWRPKWFGEGGGKMASVWHVWDKYPKHSPRPEIVFVNRKERP